MFMWFRRGAFKTSLQLIASSRNSTKSSIYQSTGTPQTRPIRVMLKVGITAVYFAIVKIWLVRKSLAAWAFENLSLTL
ncbi:unnamed protein product [Leptidea sinapis]|uniref:Uncharacterized protein n=1 Tax=Leptidea sinapis TaxID=189913 RepID=A0A5E4PK97_9NEOP|nr:unnamed protein product [Leptidea sinapis]